MSVTLTVDGLPVGAGTPYGLVNITGLRGLPDVRTGDVERAGADGLFAGTELLGGRTVVLDLVVTAATAEELAGLLAALRARLRPGRPEWPLLIDQPAAPARRLMVRCREVDAEEPFEDAAARVARLRARLDATDPLVRSAAEASVNVPSALGAQPGVTPPIVFPLVFGGVVVVTVAVHNDGDTPADWVAVMHGPLTGPAVEHADGPTVSVDVTVPPGSTLVLDSRWRTVTLDGADHYGRATRTEWFRLAPGPNGVRLRAADGTGTMAFRWRHAWT